MKREQSSDTLPDKILQFFKKDEQEEVHEIWKQADEADQSRHISVSENEKERAFDNIISRIELDESEPTYVIPIYRKMWFRAAAIITVVILAGIAMLSIPMTIEAPEGEFTSHILPDGSEIILNSGSAVSYGRIFGLLNRNISLTGEAFFNVEKGEKTFTVSTHNAEIRVTGTRFNVRSWPDESDQTSVDLQEGSLELYSVNNSVEPVRLLPGQGSVVEGLSEKPQDPERISPEKAFAWTENRFSFENRPVFQILREIERRYALNIAVTERGILNDSLTIYYNNQVEAEQIIRDISQAKALKYREVNGGYVIE
jgi:ferric-dicitrate binding protein FerR (iron transport regulator)